MCYHRPAAASAVLGVAIAGTWAIETHRAAITTVLGAALGIEVLVALVAVLVAFRRVFEEHRPDRIVEHGHHHHHEHPIHTPPAQEMTGWPLQAWEGSRERGRAA